MVSSTMLGEEYMRPGDGAPEDEQELAGWEKLFSCIRPPPVYFWAKVLQHAHICIGIR